MIREYSKSILYSPINLSQRNNMTYFLKSGNTFRVSSNEAMDIRAELPPGNYTVRVDPFTKALFLEHIGSFTIPKKIYGDCLSNTDRIISTFLDRPNSTGVMLTGEKGSGKTLLSKNVCMKLSTMNIPTIVINEPFFGDTFNTFIQSIEQPCAILFDEFEKVYDKEGQEQILTLLDGVFPTKKLFLLTCNDKWRVDQHMRNRPGRIYYMLDFKGLEPSFIREYCEDTLREKQHIERIVTLSALFSEFNFDMLKALVEEMNRYGDTPHDALRMLNAKPEFDNGSKFSIKIVHEGKEIVESCTEKFEGNPLRQSGIDIQFDPNPENDDGEYIYTRFTSNQLVKVDATAGVFVFKDKNTTATLTRIKQRTFSYDDGSF